MHNNIITWRTHFHGREYISLSSEFLTPLEVNDKCCLAFSSSLLFMIGKRRNILLLRFRAHKHRNIRCFHSRTTGFSFVFLLGSHKWSVHIMRPVEIFINPTTIYFIFVFQHKFHSKYI